MTTVLFYQLGMFSPEDFTDEDLEDDEDVWKSEEYLEVHKWLFTNAPFTINLLFIT